MFGNPQRKLLGNEIGTNTIISNINLILSSHDRKRDRKSGSAGMPRPISYAVFCLKKEIDVPHRHGGRGTPGAGVPRHAAPRRARRSGVHSPGGPARSLCFVVFFNDTATTEIYTLSLHDALPI